MVRTQISGMPFWFGVGRMDEVFTGVKEIYSGIYRKLYEFHMRINL